MIGRDICPDEAQLTRLIEGRLAARDEARVAQHIDHCERCQRLVQRLAPARDELLPLCVTGAELQLESREHALKRAIDRLHSNEGMEADSEADPTNHEKALDALSPSERSDSLGRLGPYEISEIIECGGMGTVFKAIDTTLNRVVAVKMLSPALTSNGTARQRFIREAHSAAAVVHDHVITIHAVDESDGQPFLVMQYVSGISLQEKIDRNGPLEVKEILRIAKQIASGLAAAHEQGLVHRDIKPSNILLENGVERVKITDFGLARAVDDASVTHNDVIAGTPQYMAPEQANGGAVDHRSDLFSLGSVMYTMCTGHPPFRGDGSIATLRSVSDQKPRPIRELAADIPVWLVEIVDRLHEKDPAKRFQSATEVERLLAERLAYVQHPATRPTTSVTAQDAPVGTAKDLPSKQRRHRSTFRLVGGLLLLLIGLSIAEMAGATRIIQSLATVFRIETPTGTVVVEVEDPNATVTLDGKAISIGANGFRELRLKPGSYDLNAERQGIPGGTRRVTVTDGSKEVVRIGFEQRAPEAGEEGTREAADQRQKSNERVAILKQRVDVLEQQYRSGNATIDGIVRASNDLLEAKLELANSPEERIKILEEQVGNLQTLETVTTQRYQVGECGVEDVLAVRAELLNAEAQLNRGRKSPEQIKNLQEQVNFLKQRSQQYKAGELTFDEVVAAQADRVEAEARLQSEQAHTCSMHPQVRKMGPGNCPICGMTLLPADRGDHAAASPDVLRTVGTVDYDQRHIAHIRTRLPARVDRVHADHVGIEVKEGDPLVELSSEKLYSMEEELIQALKYLKEQPQDEQSIDLVATARERLRLSGPTEEQINDIEKRDKPSGRLTLFAPASGIVTEIHTEQGARVESHARLLTISDPERLWINLNAREADLPHLSLNQRVTLATDGLPRETFAGRIAFIAPVLDRETRTVRVQIDFANPDRKLRPGMFIRGDVHVGEAQR